MTKIQAQYEDLKKAFGRLKEAVILPSDVTINQDATIQRFEFTFELAWKLMKTILETEGLEAISPKNVIREGATIGLIDDPQKWFGFLENRNLSVHTYKEEIAKKVYQSAKEFIPFVDKLILKAKDYLT
ncbi:Nucleotidyltransferase [Candidatus Roizmanbacteria bacterium]|nr:Nucleotidyltransferase [Candidatus Roizmanbacteria bacterium]